MKGKNLAAAYFLFLFQSTSAIFRFHNHEEFQNEIYSRSDAVNSDQKIFFYWFHQTLDHFHPTDNRTWKQLFYIDDRYYKQGGPVFFYIGGEGNIYKPNYMDKAQWIKWGIEENALIIQLEHRFYGRSQPFDEMDLQALTYLTIDQALADIALFCNYIMKRQKLDVNTKWIAFGGSYPGALAAWVRMLYPHLIHGSVASSAPVLTTMDFGDYFQVVLKDLKETCKTLVPEIMSQLKNLTLLINSNERSLVTKIFPTCKDVDFKKKFDRYAFFEQILAVFQYGAQYGKMKEICSELSDTSKGSLLTRIALLTKEKNYLTYYENCIASYETILKYFNNTSAKSWNGNFGFRPWLHQTCTEVGYFQTTSSLNKYISGNIKLEYFIGLCNDVFGLHKTEHTISKSVTKTNILKGGRALVASNIIFVNGMSDPWNVLSITQRFNENINVTIHGGYHCQDMISDKPDDSDDLISSREQVNKFIKNILNS